MTARERDLREVCLDLIAMRLLIEQGRGEDAAATIDETLARLEGEIEREQEAAACRSIP